MAHDLRQACVLRLRGGPVQRDRLVRQHPPPTDQLGRARGHHDQQWTDQLVELFADDHGPAAEIVASGRLEFAADNTHDLPSVPTCHNGSMVIIGDAAHAPSPTSGQGASMAIEDAVVLAKCLRDISDIPTTLATYEGLRRDRVERIVTHGARTGRNKTPGPVGRALADVLLPVVFKLFVTEKKLAWMYDHRIKWHAPITSDLAT